MHIWVCRLRSPLTAQRWVERLVYTNPKRSEGQMQTPWRFCTCCGQLRLRGKGVAAAVMRYLGLCLSPPSSSRSCLLLSHISSVVFFALARGLEGLCSEGEGNLAVVFLKGRWIYVWIPGFPRPVPGGLFLDFKKLEETVEEMTHRVRALAVKSKGPEFKTPSTHLKAWDYKVKTGGS